MKTAEDFHREKLKEIGYKDEVIDSLMSQYRHNHTYSFAERYAEYREKEYAHTKLQEAIDLKECLACGVPNHSHGTCCGWENASGFITNGRFDAETKKEDWLKFKATLQMILNPPKDNNENI